MVTPGSGELLSIAARLLLPLPALGTRTLKPRRQTDQGRDSHCSARPCTSMLALGTDLGDGKEVGKLEAFLKKKERKIYVKMAGAPRKAVLGPVA